MSSPAQTLARKTWIALRFVLFGCGGFYVMLMGSVLFVVRILDSNQDILRWWISLPLGFAGALMVLYGVGEWRRWAYLLVFLSIPVTFLACAFVDTLLFPHSGKNHALFVIMITGVAAFLTLLGVKSFYERQAAHQIQIQSDERDVG